MFRNHYKTVDSNHLCGLYYNVPHLGRLQKSYLPRVEVNVHTSILATTSRTKLQQTFQNPSTTRGIREVRYAFPLYDGVSVVGFQCHVGNRLIVGEVKEKENANMVYKEAVDRGETAGLLEQLPEASDVFTMTIGNIPPGAKVTVDITYLGELKHDMEVDGIRFTIPTSICPRYGEFSSSHQQLDGTIAITVDAEIAQGSFIQRMQSPSHPISMSMGATSVEPDAAPSMSKASATLSLGVAHLDTDFVLQVIAKDTGIPRAILETHPTIPNQRALMTTLVPKFALPSEKPEVVFVCDQSGSMGGSSIDLAKEALQVFLKSLPVGVKFNVCSFGSRYDFLFPRSASYSEDTLATATRHAARLSANYGGTEMLEPLRATIERRYKDTPLDIILLTDGEIWAQQALFDYLNAQIQETQAPIRVFTLGIGSGVSHSLIEGIARAGNGFAQCVQAGEKMNSKVVRMLKGALSPHVNDYRLEVKYANAHADNFELVEKVADGLHVELDLSSTETEHLSQKISLYNKSPPASPSPPTDQDRFSHLPPIPAPKILQAPQSIPPLFSFTRSTIYLLLSPHAPTATPTSVVLRGTSSHGPLELEIPVHDAVKGETVHQLAAKKAVGELEMGRGWLTCARASAASPDGAKGELLKDKFEGRFSDMVEREAVRLGVQFQVGGKWTSFVAVERTIPKSKASDDDDEVMDEDWEFLEDEKVAEMATFRGGGRGNGRAGGKSRFGAHESIQRIEGVRNSRGGRGGSSSPARERLYQPAEPQFPPVSLSPPTQGFGSALQYNPTSPSHGGGSAFGQESKPAAGGLFGAASQYTSTNPAYSAGSLFGGGKESSKPSTSSLFGAAPHPARPHAGQPVAAATPASGSLFGSTSPSHAKVLQDYQSGSMVLHQEDPKRLQVAPVSASASSQLDFGNGAATPYGLGTPTFDKGLDFGGGDAALENFDFDSFLHGKDSSGAEISHDFLDFKESACDSYLNNGAATTYNLGAPTYSPSVSASASAYDASFTPLAAAASFPTYNPTSPSYAPMAASASYSPTSPVAKENEEEDTGSDMDMGFGLFPEGETASDLEEEEEPSRPVRRRKRSKRNPFIDVEAEVDEEVDSDTTVSGPEEVEELQPKDLLDQTQSPAQEVLRLLIAHQSCSGMFPYHPKVLGWLGISVSDFRKAQREVAVSSSASAQEQSGYLITTALVIVYMEKKLADYKDEWELVVEKARSWLEGQCVSDGGAVYREAAARML
ncbi:hypothetical protein E8E11_003275 [Didymella keratinophila]|nr:hypothetical protein E8E11_003275 [Didymella keratinophila]